MPLLANARMYSVAPAAAAAWRGLFDLVATRSGVALQAIEHAFPATLESLWERDDLGCAFMCGWPYATLYATHRLVAAPVPAPPRYGGRPVYFTDFVVRADAPYRTLADTFGRRFAYTLESSHSGWNAPRYHLARYRSQARPTLFGEIVGPFFTPRRVLDAVIDGKADVAPLDGYALDLLRRHAPELVARVRVIESTDAAPIPPIVAAPMADRAVSARLQATFIALRADPKAKPFLEDLLLGGFVGVTPADYALTRERAEAAEAAGYSRIV